MNPAEGDAEFVGSIPQIYDRYLVPFIFESYAAAHAGRVLWRRPAHVLSLAAGTGVVTRELARVLPPEVTLVATDLHQPVLDQAAIGPARPVVWRQADAGHLPFPDAEFDVVICQFAVMLFPDKTQALRKRGPC